MSVCVRVGVLGVGWGVIAHPLCAPQTRTQDSCLQKLTVEPKVMSTQRRLSSISTRHKATQLPVHFSAYVNSHRTCQLPRGSSDCKLLASSQVHWSKDLHHWGWSHSARVSHDVLLCEALPKETKAPGDVDECEQLLDTFQVQQRITIENTFHKLFRSRA